MSHRETFVQNLLLSSDYLLLNQNRKPFDWLLKQQILQEHHSFLREKVFMAISNPIVSTLDLHYSFWFETEIILRTQAVNTLAYNKELQDMQDQVAILLTQIKRMTSTAATSGAAQSLQTVPFEIHIQQDATLDNADVNTDVIFSKNTSTNTSHQRDPTNSFPSRLHEILSNPEYSECITWLPHGRSWKILRPTQFERLVIPRHFRHGKYSSFMRQVNEWGFQRTTKSPDHNSYSHPQFMRDSPQLCRVMRRPFSLGTSRSRISLSQNDDR